MGVEYYEDILLVTSIIYDEIYKVDPSNGELISSFASPGSGPMDFAWDGEYLWNADWDTDRIFRCRSWSILVGFCRPDRPDRFQLDTAHLPSAMPSNR